MIQFSKKKKVSIFNQIILNKFGIKKICFFFLLSKNYIKILNDIKIDSNFLKKKTYNVISAKAKKKKAYTIIAYQN